MFHGQLLESLRGFEELMVVKFLRSAASRRDPAYCQKHSPLHSPAYMGGRSLWRLTS